MQLFLPIFAEKTRMINYKLGFQRIDDFVHYLVDGLPIYSHAVGDKNGYRYIMATLVNNNFVIQVIQATLIMLCWPSPL